MQNCCYCHTCTFDTQIWNALIGQEGQVQDQHGDKEVHQNLCCFACFPLSVEQISVRKKKDFTEVKIQTASDLLPDENVHEETDDQEKQRQSTTDWSDVGQSINIRSANVCRCRWLGSNSYVSVCAVKKIISYFLYSCLTMSMAKKVRCVHWQVMLLLVSTVWQPSVIQSDFPVGQQ